MQRALKPTNMIQVKIINRKFVKPCIPTPQNLQNYQFSFTDEFDEGSIFGVLFFYASSETKINLEESLAKVLVQFYPLAGRLKMNDRCVDCSDQGIDFIEARAPDVELPTLIAERNLRNLDGFFPTADHQQDEANRPILLVQITLLKCGGLALAIQISHKIFDASSLGMFLTAWSNASNPRSEMPAINPIFDSMSLFPRKSQKNIFNSHIVLESPDVIKLFTFNKEAIAFLRSKLRQKFMSRVRVVSAVIAKALISVDQAKHGGTSRPCTIFQPINIRERTIPPLPKNLCGNLVLRSCTGAVEAKDMGFQELVDLLSKAIEKSVSKCGEILSLDKDERYKLMVEPIMNELMVVSSGKHNLLWFSDWSKFGFNKFDIGWGEPVGATVAPEQSPSPGALLMENKEGGGIDAWVFLDEHGMALFEQDEEIRSLARN